MQTPKDAGGTRDEVRTSPEVSAYLGEQAHPVAGGG